jgi:hypothetical protein
MTDADLRALYRNVLADADPVAVETFLAALAREAPQPSVRSLVTAANDATAKALRGDWKRFATDIADAPHEALSQCQRSIDPLPLSVYWRWGCSLRRRHIAVRRRGEEVGVNPALEATPLVLAVADASRRLVVVGVGLSPCIAPHPSKAWKGAFPKHRDPEFWPKARAWMLAYPSEDRVWLTFDQAKEMAT